MSAPVLVTGATGAVGGRVARSLAEAGVPVRLFVRSADRAPQLPGAEVAVGAYDDRKSCERALRGIGSVFMVSATESPRRGQDHKTFVAAAAQAGVDQLVYTSFAGAAPDATFTFARDHFFTEQAIRAAGLSHTFLRDNFYLDVLPLWVGDDGVIAGPAGDGAVAAVARRDVAAVATAVLLDPARHPAATYTLTGPQPLTLTDIAHEIGAARGRPVRYRPETVREAYASRSGYAAPRWQEDAWVSTYTAIAAGELAEVTDDVERVTGRPPMSLAQLLREDQAPSGN